MKKRIVLILLLIPLVTMAQETALSVFLIKWENSKNYLIEIARAMPEASYSYKPSERQMTFQEQLLHIQKNMDWLATTYFNQPKQAEKRQKLSKKEIIMYLETSFDAVSEAIKKIPGSTLQEEVDFFAGPKTKLQILNLLQDHVTHHRGQLIVYLNLNNIKPPKYSGW